MKYGDDMAFKLVSRMVSMGLSTNLEINFLAGYLGLAMFLRANTTNMMLCVYIYIHKYIRIYIYILYIHSKTVGVSAPAMGISPSWFAGSPR